MELAIEVDRSEVATTEAIKAAVDANGGVFSQKSTDRSEEEIELLADPFTVLAIAGGVTAVVKAFMEWRERQQGGTQIDLRTTPALAKRSPEIPYGVILLIGEDGTADIQTHDSPKDAIERWIAVVLEKVTPTVGDVPQIGS